jgi:hypothetical protein
MSNICVPPLKASVNDVGSLKSALRTSTPLLANSARLTGVRVVAMMFETPLAKSSLMTNFPNWPDAPVTTSLFVIAIDCPPTNERIDVSNEG